MDMPFNLSHYPWFYLQSKSKSIVWNTCPLLCFHHYYQAFNVLSDPLNLWIVAPVFFSGISPDEIFFFYQNKKKISAAHQNNVFFSLLNLHNCNISQKLMLIIMINEMMMMMLRIVARVHNSIWIYVIRTVNSTNNINASLLLTNGQWLWLWYDLNYDNSTFFFLDHYFHIEWVNIDDKTSISNCRFKRVAYE